MSAYAEVQNELRKAPQTWLITGVAGFIGSNLLETLLRLDQRVVGLDNISTGTEANLEEVRSLVGPEQWGRFRFVRGDITDLDCCRQACRGVEIVLHQAALGSVPASMDDPLKCHRSNVTGFLNMLMAGREAKTRRFVYASSSAVYGDEPATPALEKRTGRPLSPYAASKAMDELYAASFSCAFGFNSIGLRYFNVFGPRQDPEGAYAAVIPKWIAALLRREAVFINGDGETSRDFCFIENVVQANLLAASARNPAALNEVYNIAVGERTTLNELFRVLQNSLRAQEPALPPQAPVYREFRPGDVRHSVADVSKAKQLLGYAPTHRIQAGIEAAMSWYLRNA
jgi:UDP-N-acetylglucosamine/UDP-N-acetylgalactosamine 4-epimerase